MLEGYEWFHPGMCAFPENGNQIVVQNTKTGPHIGDICKWLRLVLEVNYVDYTWVPPKLFREAVLKTKKYTMCSFTLVRTDRGTRTQMLPDASMARELDCEHCKIEVRPDGDGLVDRSPVLKFLKKVIPGWGTKADRNGKDLPYDYMLEDATLIPEGDESPIVDILRYKKDARRQILVSTTPSGEPQVTELYRVFGEELAHWIEEDSE